MENVISYYRTIACFLFLLFYNTKKILLTTRNIQVDILILFYCSIWDVFHQTIMTYYDLVGIIYILCHFFIRFLCVVVFLVFDVFVLQQQKSDKKKLFGWLSYVILLWLWTHFFNNNNISNNKKIPFVFHHCYLGLGKITSSHTFAYSNYETYILELRKYIMMNNNSSIEKKTALIISNKNECKIFTYLYNM